ncbi:Blp family class II bacteriocin [Streptococcus mutans]|uniref:Blp family class II bacteriocin n=1 Tax=Streptococcus mutans TaxID=1309 RepID=UPI0022851FD2|nr:Blp family class II bacteriocin [Streptococcus mutans]MCY7120158.1 Blp family class II bacteriocin [Streptococcus mutans]
MNTQAFEQFNVMDNEALSAVEGGGRGWNCAAGIALGAGQGYMATAGGTTFLGPYAIGTGAFGAIAGGIGGALNSCG